MTTRTPSDLLLDIALDLNLSLTSVDRYRRLVTSVANTLDCDAAVLFRVSGEELLPLNAHGLRADGLGRTYLRREHPRLDLICSSREPTRFPSDSPLPDPFDGLLADAHGIEKIHACLGCPLWVEDELVGVLSLDARRPNTFDRFEDRFLTALSALTAAVMRTSNLMDTLEKQARHQNLVAKDLIREAGQQRGHLLLGNTPPMVRLREEISLYARSDFPVLILGDGMIGQMMEPVEFPTEGQGPPMEENDWALTGSEGRERRIVNSLYLTPEENFAHNIHLKEKYDLIAANEQRSELYGEDYDLLLVAFGTMARICKSAIDDARRAGLKIALFRPITLWPYPEKACREAMDALPPGGKVLDIEMNMGQMIYDVRLAAEGSRQIEFFGKTGGLVPSPEEVLARIRELMEECNVES